MSARPPAPARRRPPRDDVRRALLEAAARVFARRGIEGSTLDDVAADAGFTKGAVYSNFDSKQALVSALVEDRTSAYLTLGLEAVAEVDQDARDLAVLAQVLGDRLTAAGDEQRDWHLLFLELWQRAVRTQDPGGTFGEQRASLRAAVSDAIGERAARSGTSLSMPASDLAIVLMALVNGLAVERMIAPDDVPADLMGRVLALLVNGPASPRPV
ncbi:TetR/AcrR family transcriptional regulator [Nocardioides plantarum]|uniref:TetR/AcrR family transcriptional regulator n=1 Tax=Nocardioides plantarum TaxID=29299 RepID=A0ABV5KBI9_9ACTN|nr:TetR/AcrR family transcriptional regulator [Nocardioides plantarum]